MNAPDPVLKSRGRRHWRWLLLVPVVLVVLAALLIAGLLWTSMGRDVLLVRVQGLLPQGSLQWRSAQGSLGSGLRLDGVHFSDAGVVLDLERVELDLSLAALLAGDVQVRRLVLVDGRLQLPEAAPEPTPWPARIELPESLPTLVLPVGLRLDAVQVQRLAVLRDGESVLELHAFTLAAVLADGRLQIDRFALDSDRIGLDLSGRIDTSHDWVTALKARASLPLAPTEPLVLDLEMHGSLADMEWVARADVGEEARLRLHAAGGLPTPDWTLELDAPRIVPQRVGIAGEPMALSLRAEGNLAQARLQGHFTGAGIDLALSPSVVSYQDARIGLAPLALAGFGGVVEVSGEIGLAGATPEGALGLEWRDLALPMAAAATPVHSSGQARLDGPLDAYALSLDAALARADETARIELRGHGSDSELDIERLAIGLPGGRLDASGNLAWASETKLELAARLRDFDPSWFQAELPGKLDARLDVEGGWNDAGAWGELRLGELAGQLRGRGVAGTARLVAAPDGSGEGEVDLHIGASRLAARGRFGAQLALDARFDPLHPDDLFANAGGSLRGTLSLRGRRDTPELVLDLRGTDLRLDEAQAATLNLAARLDAAGRAEVELDARQLLLAGQAIDAIVFAGEGDQAGHSLRLRVDAGGNHAAAALDGGLEASGARWQGRLQQVQLKPEGHTAWSLREPVALAWNRAASTLTLAHACLDAAPASACVAFTQEGDSTQGELDMQGLDLALLDPLLASTLGRQVTITGELAAVARIAHTGASGLRGTVTVTVPKASVQTDSAGVPVSFDVSGMQTDLRLNDAGVEAVFEAKLGDEGRLRAHLTSPDPLAEAAPLAGGLELSLPDLAVLGLFSDQIVRPVGRVEGRLALAGTRAAPQLDGTLELIDFAAEVPALGIAPGEGHVVLRSADAGTLELDGSVRLGEGVAQLAGRFDPDAAGGVAGELQIRGENLDLIAVPEAQVRASPDLRIELTGTAVNVRGTLAVPRARIDLERLQSVDAPSPDVVVLDQPEPTPGLAVDADVKLRLGEDVRMSGFGLKGTLAGELRVRDRPGRATTARGAVEVGGIYKAYGQDLRITRGHIAWAATPIDTPSLDVRAERKLDDITVGVQVRGPSSAPELSLWSQPAMEQAEQLSYLVLGRPLRSATQAEGSQLSQAAAAMGGNLLAKHLGARLGLDEMEVADNRALGGAALTVGMYLSPRLHVSYGVALFGTGQVITFKYLLSRLWNVQIDSGTEDRVTLNYRREQ